MASGSSKIPVAFPLPTVWPEATLCGGRRRVSTTWADREDHGVEHSRLHSTTGEGAWCTKKEDAAPFIIEEFGEEVIFTGVALQGRAVTAYGSQFVTVFLVAASMDGETWIEVKAGTPQRADNPFLFRGNSDTSSVVKSNFAKAVRARMIKITIVKFNTHPSLRFDSLGYLPAPATGGPAASGGGGGGGGRSDGCGDPSGVDPASKFTV